MFKKSKKSFVGKISSVIVIALVFALCSVGIVSAASGSLGEVFTPTMGINFLGITPQPFAINGVQFPPAINYKGTNYFAGRALEEAGGTAAMANGVAVYTAPMPNMGNNNECSEASRAVAYLYKNGQQVGNAFFFETGNGTELILSKNAWEKSHIIKDYKKEIIPINSTPIKQNDRLVWIKTNGYKSPYTLPIATVEPKAGDTSNLITSINGISNMVNYSKVKDYYDFNVFTTGDLRYLRTYNDSEQSCEGSPTVNDNGEVIGIYMWRGANYSLFIDLDDTRSFLNLN